MSKPPPMSNPSNVKLTLIANTTLKTVFVDSSIPAFRSVLYCTHYTLSPSSFKYCPAEV